MKKGNRPTQNIPTCVTPTRTSREAKPPFKSSGPPAFKKLPDPRTNPLARRERIS